MLFSDFGNPVKYGVEQMSVVRLRLLEQAERKTNDSWIKICDSEEQ